MKIDINDETVERIMADVMVQDYHRLEADIKRYEDKPILSEVEKADLENWNTVIQALEIVIEYYVGYHWKNRYA